MSWHSNWTTMKMLVSNFNCFCHYFTWTWFVLTFNHTLIYEMYLCTLCKAWHVCWIMYDLACMLVKSRPFVELNGLPGLYGLKCDSATACGLLLFLCSYKLDGSATPSFYLNRIMNRRLMTSSLSRPLGGMGRGRAQPNAPALVLAFLNAITKYGDRIHP